MLRAEWFIRKYASIWRKAILSRRCDCKPNGGLQCLNYIQPGDKYLDTRMNRGQSPHYCIECALGELK